MSPTGDGTTILGGHLSHAKVYFKTLSFGLVHGIEPNIVKKFVKIL